MIIESGEDRLIVELDDVPAARLGQRTLEGTDILTTEDLDHLSGSGGTFGPLFDRATSLAG